MSTISTTTVIAGHAFDCYVELIHNDNCIARAFGEAKNYELLSSHLETFRQWLNDVKFNPFTSDGNPSDLAFMIAPICPSLLQRKLELKNIQFIKSIKSERGTEATPATDDFLARGQTPEGTYVPNWVFPRDNITAINVNTADKKALITAFKGTGIKQTTVEKLINHRPYESLSVMASDLKFTKAVRQKLQDKLDSGRISFDYSD